MRNDDYAEVPRTMLLATGLWTLVVAEGTRAEVFARLPGEVVTALALFATAFAVSAVTVDARVRGWFEPRGVLSALLALFALAGMLLATGAALAMTGERHVGAFPWAPLALVGLPLTAALLVTALRVALHEGAGAARAPAAMAPLFGRR
jgi:hypothetical protein